MKAVYIKLKLEDIDHIIDTADYPIAHIELTPDEGRDLDRLIAYDAVAGNAVTAGPSRDSWEYRGVRLMVVYPTSPAFMNPPGTR